MKKRISTFLTYNKDPLIAAALGVVTFVLLLTQLHAPGVTWDEGLVNFEAAKNQAEWIRNVSTLEQPFSQETIDRYWFTTSDHPSLPRTMAAVSHTLFSGFVDEVTALRIPSALLFSVLVATVYLFLRAFVNVPSALAGAFSLILMPRVWGHAHLFSLDLPILCWWFWTGAIGYWVLVGRMRAFWFGLAYAFAFSTKLHSVFLPLPILLWIAIVLYQNQQERRVLLTRVGWAVVWVLVLTPVVYIGTQPWLWHDTFLRIGERFFEYAEKSVARPIPLYYLGEVYGQNTPWHYPLVMFGVTVPVTILFLVLLGILSPAFHMIKASAAAPLPSNYGIYWLALFLFFVPLLPVLLPLAQAYDGCRLFLPCFPLAAIMAGFGFSNLLTLISRYLKESWKISILLVALFGYPAYSLVHYHPFYLAYYNEAVGGIRGAKEMGFETVYWCDALTKDFLEQINEVLADDETVHPKSMSHEVIDYYISRGWVKEDFKDHPWDYALLQSRQGMFNQEEWLLYLRRKPVVSQELDGVQLYGLYRTLDQ